MSVLDDILMAVDPRYLDVLSIEEEHLPSLEKKKCYNIVARTKPSIYYATAQKAIFCRVFQDYFEMACSGAIFYDVNRKDFALTVNSEIPKMFPMHQFGCCHKYVECSDARGCVSDDYLYSTGCQYRKNLEAGRVFYGKNRNV